MESRDGIWMLKLDKASHRRALALQSTARDDFEYFCQPPRLIPANYLQIFGENDFNRKVI
jgi:hypothetical protein